MCVCLSELACEDDICTPPLRHAFVHIYILGPNLVLRVLFEDQSEDLSELACEDDICTPPLLHALVHFINTVRQQTLDILADNENIQPTDDCTTCEVCAKSFSTKGFLKQQPYL